MNSWLNVLAVSACLLGGARVSLGATTPVARILSVRGEVKISTSDDEARPARTYGAVYDKDKLQLAPGAKIDLAFQRRGRRAAIEAKDAMLTIAVRRSSLEPAESVVWAEATDAVSSAVAGAVSYLPTISPGGVSILRGPPPESAFSRIQPIHESAVITGTPIFEWPAVAGADHYTLEVLDGDAKRQWLVTVDEPRYQTPSEKALTGSNRIYDWKVTAFAAGTPTAVCEGTLTVHEADYLEGIDLLAESEDPSLQTLAAGAYEGMALYSEAISVYERLAEADPENPTFHAALSDLYERAGDAERAAVARSNAKELGFEFETNRSEQAELE